MLRLLFIGVMLLSIGVMEVFPSSARAADPIFPHGSRIGLVPPTGMVVAQNFLGFEDPDGESAILLRAMPAVAFPQIEATWSESAINALGIDVEKRELLKLTAGRGILIMGRQITENKSYRKWLLLAMVGPIGGHFTALAMVEVPEHEQAAYPDDAIRAALTSLTVQTAAPEHEHLTPLLPGERPIATGVIKIPEALVGQNAFVALDAAQMAVLTLHNIQSSTIVEPIVVRVYLGPVGGNPSTKLPIGIFTLLPGFASRKPGGPLEPVPRLTTVRFDISRLLLKLPLDLENVEVVMVPGQVLQGAHAVEKLIVGAMDLSLSAFIGRPFNWARTICIACLHIKRKCPVFPTCR